MFRNTVLNPILLQNVECVDTTEWERIIPNTSHKQTEEHNVFLPLLLTVHSLPILIILIVFHALAII